MYDDDDDEDDPRPRSKYVALVGLLVIGGWFSYRKVLGSDGAQGGLGLDPPAATVAPPPAPPETSDVASVPPTTAPPGTTVVPTTEFAMALVRSTTTALRPTTTTLVSTTTAEPTTVPPATTVPPPTTLVSTTSVPPNITGPAATTIAPAASALQGPAQSPTTSAGPGSMLPNGVAIGAFVTFDGEAVTMGGALPTERARNRLLMLVTAANVADKPIVNNVAVDPDAPGGDSVRLVGLDPQAFPEGTNDIYPLHATELDRLAILFHSFPNTTIVVVGRADQRGPAAQNLDIAEARADALVDYLVSRGVDADRLISVSFGEAPSTTPDDNVVALALNRRAEFVLYGLSR
jgi:outer membrane protein OmpA-like peptidoglycan-associated protein